ncbi:hypothetical protein niasHS_009963 [Heterodera schachtii]|uniref:Uncharacterized protein n=1 Tax=Heterodera schachtii TaxID=97005 RepID=A0ABD2JD62_HETSC
MPKSSSNQMPQLQQQQSKSPPDKRPKLHRQQQQQKSSPPEMPSALLKNIKLYNRPPPSIRIPKGTTPKRSGHVVRSPTNPTINYQGQEDWCLSTKSDALDLTHFHDIDSILDSTLHAIVGRPVAPFLQQRLNSRPLFHHLRQQQQKFVLGVDGQAFPRVGPHLNAYFGDVKDEGLNEE